MYSVEATQKARAVMNSTLGQATIVVKLMEMRPNIDYSSDKSVIVSLLKEDGSMSLEEINSVDYDQLVMPFLRF